MAGFFARLRARRVSGLPSKYSALSSPYRPGGHGLWSTVGTGRAEPVVFRLFELCDCPAPRDHAPLDLGHPLLAESNQPLIEVVDLEGDMVVHASLAPSATVGNELEPCVAGAQKHQLFGAQAEPLSTPSPKTAW